MERPKDSWPRNYKNVTIKMRDSSIIKGKVNIKGTDRLSVLFRSVPENFIPVVPEEGSKKVFIINRSHILWIESDE